MATQKDAREQAEVKAWLRELLEASGHSKTALAREFGVEPKTIFNAFSGSASLPRGLTFYRLLRELGALKADAPGSDVTIAGRLAGLEAQVSVGFESLEAAIEQLNARLPGQAAAER